MGILSVFGGKKGQLSSGVQTGVCVFDDAVCFITYEEKTENASQCVDIPIEESIEKALEKGFRALHKKGLTALGLGNHYYQFLDIDKPAVEQQEINQVLKWSIKDLVNFEPSDLVIDHLEKPAQVLGQDKIYAVAGQITKLKPIVDTITAEIGGIAQISVFETLLRHLVKREEHAKLLIFQLPGKEVNLQIIKNGQVYFNRKLRGYNRFADYSADEIKMGAADALMLEVQRSLDYFESQLKQDPVSELDILLAHEEKDVLKEVLANGLNLTVNWLEQGDLTSQQMLTLAVCKEMTEYLSDNEKLD